MVTFKLFNYPQQAIFGKILPKSKIYEFAKPSNAVKELFIKQVEQIVWEYKLSPETINIPPGEGVEEIQILKIYSKVPEIDYRVYRTIDEAIPSQIFYEVVVGDKTKFIASYKRPNEADSGRWVIGAYLESEWVSTFAARDDIPIALNMGGLYTQMLRALIIEAPLDGESLKNQIDRLGLIKSTSNELHRLRIKLSKEKQFNRKIEINSQIKILESQIQSLIR
jgi:hypothetical protein